MYMGICKIWKEMLEIFGFFIVAVGILDLNYYIRWLMEYGLNIWDNLGNIKIID